MDIKRATLTALRWVSIGTTGTAITIAALNKLVRATAPAPEAPFADEQQLFAWSQGSISYTATGTGEAIILLHGIYAGASSYEFRRIFHPLAQAFRVYAPDLPGFGNSERSMREYTPDLYVDFIKDFVKQVAGGADQPVYIIASSLTAAFVIQAVVDRPDLFERIILIEPAGMQSLSDHPGIAQQTVGTILRMPLLGEALYNALVSRPGLRYFLSHQVYLKQNQVTDDVIDSYYATSHTQNARFAIASFVGGYLNCDVSDIFDAVARPVLLCWGRKATITPLEDAEMFLDLNDNAELAIFDHSSALPHDEEPEDFVQQIMSWLRAGISSHR